MVDLHGFSWSLVYNSSLSFVILASFFLSGLVERQLGVALGSTPQESFATFLVLSLPSSVLKANSRP